MESLFTYRDDIEGKIGIGKLPSELQSILHDILKEYNNIIPDKNATTFHTWYKDISPSIKSKIEQIQKNNFWNKICDGSKKCIKINVNEMDELYYSNPKNNLDKINLYGAVSNYNIHRDCFFNYNGIKFYRIIIGLTDGNDNIITYFNNLKVGHKINSGDYIIFDFDKTTHQIIKETEKLTPRILLKIHYIVCENCEYTKEHVESIKKMYLYYEIITRYIMNTGTDPKTYYQFFFGLGCQFWYTKNIQYNILSLIITIIIILNIVFKIKLVQQNVLIVIKYVLFSLIFIYLLIVMFYWSRYKLIGIR